MLLLFREIGLQEAQYFSAIFASEETPLISGALTVVSNLAAFARNQEIFREAGLFCVLPKLMLHSNGQIKQNACIVVANMAINEKNNTGNTFCFNFTTILYINFKLKSLDALD